MVRPRRSGFDSARATISSLPLRAVPAAGATGATNAAAPVSARAATIFCIVSGSARERAGKFSRSSLLLCRRASSLRVLGLSLCATAAAGACSRSLCHRRGRSVGDGRRSVGAKQVPRAPQAGAAFSQASEASPPTNWNRCRASARYVSDTQPWMIDWPKSSSAGRSKLYLRHALGSWV